MMARTRRSSLIGDVLPQVLSNLNLEKPLREYRAVEVWEEAVLYEADTSGIRTV